MKASPERSEKILSAIVQGYISTAEPVSSKAIAADFSLGLSSATVRNTMAELESEGLLMQPHTSSGRIPTDKGFRYYVDTLLKLEEPEDGDKDVLRRSCSGPIELEKILAETTKALAALTSCATLMFAPRRESFIIRHVNFVPLDRGRMMVVMVSRAGMVRSRTIRLEDGVDGLDVEKITNYINSIAGGLTVRELRERIVEEMKKEKNLYDRLLSRALSLGAMAFSETKGAVEGLYVEGQVNIFDAPEFREDIERMKDLFAAFEEKSLLVRMLDRSMDDEGTSIYLGSEGEVDAFNGLSFVTAPYGRSSEVLGTLGVMGPVRMNYSRIIPLVGFTAGLLSKVFREATEERTF